MTFSNQPRRTRAPLLLFLLPAIIVPSVSAREKRWDVSLEATGAYFNWKEFGPWGERLLLESGPHIGAALDVAAGTGLSRAQGRFDLYFGSVRYDGALNDSVRTPLRTRTGYRGFKVECAYAPRVRFTPTVHLIPSAGLALRYWKRLLDNVGYREHGYDERWLFFHVPLCARLELKAGRRATVCLGGGVRLALFTSATSYHDSPQGPRPLYLHPGRRTTHQAEIAARIGRGKLSLRFENFSMTASPTALDAEGNRWMQPASRGFLVGIGVGGAF